MQFSMLKFAVAAFAVCSSNVLAQITPVQVVENIQMLTSKSQALQPVAQSITIVNGPLIVIGQGPFPQIIAGFRDIVSTATVAISQMQNMPQVTAAADAAAIADAFREFVRVHQVLLNVLIGKAGLFSTVPLAGQPVAAVLRAVESVVDTVAFMLIDAVEGQASQISSDNNSLGQTLSTAIDSYSGLSVK